MPTTAIDVFVDSLSDQSISLTRVCAADIEEFIEEAADEPVVGAQLPFEGVSLPDNVESNPTLSELEAAQTGVTSAHLAIAEYGSVVIGERGNESERTSLFVDTHIAVVAASDVVPSMADAIGHLGDAVRDGLSSAIIATGPSATADMGELVKGAHGPKSVHVVLITDK